MLLPRSSRDLLLVYVGLAVLTILPGFVAGLRQPPIQSKFFGYVVVLPYFANIAWFTIGSVHLVRTQPPNADLRSLLTLGLYWFAFLVVLSLTNSEFIPSFMAAPLVLGGACALPYASYLTARTHVRAMRTRQNTASLDPESLRVREPELTDENGQSSRDSLMQHRQASQRWQRRLRIVSLVWLVAAGAGGPMIHAISQSNPYSPDPLNILDRLGRDKELEGPIIGLLVVTGIIIGLLWTISFLRPRRSSIGKLHLGQIVLVWFATVGMWLLTWLILAQQPNFDSPFALAVLLGLMLLGIPIASLIAAYLATWWWFGSRASAERGPGD